VLTLRLRILDVRSGVLVRERTIEAGPSALSLLPIPLVHGALAPALGAIRARGAQVDRQLAHAINDAVGFLTSPPLRRMP
jgi:hypothetical protein